MILYFLLWYAIGFIGTTLQTLFTKREVTIFDLTVISVVSMGGPVTPLSIFIIDKLEDNTNIDLDKPIIKLKDK